MRKVLWVALVAALLPLMVQAQETTQSRTSITNGRLFGTVSFGTKLTFSATAPTISSGFGTSPTISAANGTLAFRVNVGTGGVATAGIVAMPTAANGWNCAVNDLTAAAAHVAYNTRQLASTTATVSVENQTISTGAAVAWGASDILTLSCTAY